jgi:hypothetical protein
MIIGIIIVFKLSLGNQNKDGLGVECQRSENVNERGQTERRRLLD